MSSLSKLLILIRIQAEGGEGREEWRFRVNNKDQILALLQGFIAPTKCPSWAPRASPCRHSETEVPIHAHHNKHANFCGRYPLKLRGSFTPEMDSPFEQHGCRIEKQALHWDFSQDSPSRIPLSFSLRSSGKMSRQDKCVPLLLHLSLAIIFHCSISRRFSLGGKFKLQ